MNRYSVEIKWGIIFTVASILWMVVEKLMGLHGANIAKHATYSNIFAILAIGIFILALLDKRKNFFKGKMSWKQGFITGLILSLVVAILSPIAQWIILKYISPDFFTNMIAHTVEQGKLAQDLAEATYNMNSFMIQGVLGSLIMGVITSAIVAFFVKKN